ncbi:MAG: DUF1549 domain-containing protein [Pirellulales bacterium]
MRRPAAWAALFTCLALAMTAWSMASAEEPKPANNPPPEKKANGLPDAGDLAKISVEFGLTSPDGFKLAGRDARQQLVVTGQYASGQIGDLTHQVTYSAEPAGIVEVDAAGLVAPLGEGSATVSVRDANGKTASTRATVTRFAQDLPVNFPNEVVPVFTKFTCNSGGCHGKASGQNGFRLSLLGFEPPEDYEHLVKEGRLRRLFPAAPDRSLLLQKASGSVPHGGGSRIEADSAPYRVLRRWIEQGMPYGKPDDPVVARIEVYPTERTMGRNGEQQLLCIAHYSDGSTRDVTSMTQFDPNDLEMASVSPRGLVKTNELTGAVAVMARFQGHVDVFRAVVPLGAVVDNLPPAKNFIDEHVFAQLVTLGMPPSKLCDDATYIRRVSVDISGRLPSLDEVQQFLAESDPQKREKLVDQLLAGTAYADYFANKWSAVLRNKRRQESHARGTFLFHSWIRQSLYENQPYDQFVREIVAASGEMGENPPVVWYREVKDAQQQLEDTAQLFLGLRIQCAQCHHHPFEKWSQNDYAGFKAFFSRVGRKAGMQPGEERIFHQRGDATAQNPKTGQAVKATGLGALALDLPPDQDPRHALVDWMARPDNPFFARALVNRYWKHFFGRGIVDPEDDMRVTNPPSNPQLLDALSKHFIESGFDTKQLIRTICTSTTYQLSAEPNEYNAGDKQSFSRYYPKRLNAEVLLDAIDSVTAATTKFNGLPEGTRAVQLPDTSVNSYFLQVFGRPDGASACECERSGEANLAQSLHLLNSSDVQNKLTNGSGRAAQLSADKNLSHPQKIEQVYLQAFGRRPDSVELGAAQAYIEKVKNDKQAYEDILWAIVNTKEFLFNH